MSRVPGLGLEFPRDWSVTTLDEVTTKIGSGATPRGGAAVYVDHGPTLIRSQNVYDHRFEKDGLAFLTEEAAYGLRGVSVKEDDVLVNITGDSILRTTVVPSDVLPAHVNQHVAIIRANDRVAPGFLQKWLSTPVMKEYMLGHSSGGTRKAITKAQLQTFPVPLPPFEEQQAIAATLSALDDKIQSNQRSFNLARSLLDAISVTVSNNLPTVPLGNLVTVSTTSLNPATLDDTLVDHYSLPAFDAGARPERSPASAIKSNKLAVPNNAILVSRLNPRFNRTWWVSTTEAVPRLSSTEFLVLTAASPTDLASVWLAVRDPYFISELTSRVTGTSGSHQRVRPDDVLSIEVPNVSVMDSETKARALALLRRIDQFRSEIERLAALRDTLLPALLSGRIRVRPDSVLT